MKLYMCGTDWRTELGRLGSGTAQVFRSPQALKEAIDCWGECGIVEVPVEKFSWISPPEEDVYL